MSQNTYGAMIGLAIKFRIVIFRFMSVVLMAASKTAKVNIDKTLTSVRLTAILLANSLVGISITRVMFPV